MLKKALCLVFAFLLSINSFAAVVSDNDGSAFITKAEFDSLKNNFQSQLDSYNSSIDNKIDSAIASYLAGIKAEKTTTLPITYNNYKLIGNVDTTLKWCSNNNLTLCDASSQILAYDYTYVQSYGGNSVGKGGSWHWTLDSESDNRAKKRYNMTKEGYIDGRYVFRAWWMGTMAGIIYQNNSGPGGAWFTNLALQAINSRESKVYAASNGANVSGNNWWGMSTFNYFEEESATNENVAVYPLSEKDGEYVVDQSIALPTINAGSYSNLKDSPYNGTIANMSQLGSFEKFTTNNSFQDYMTPTVSGIFKKMKLANLKYQNFYDIDKANDRIKAGVVLATATDDSTITIKGKCDINGYVILYFGKVASELWAGQRSSTTDTTSWKTISNQVTANVEWTRKLEDVKNKDKIFVLYLPSSTSDYGAMTISSIVQTAKSE